MLNKKADTVPFTERVRLNGFKSPWLERFTAGTEETGTFFVQLLQKFTRTQGHTTEWIGCAVDGDIRLFTDQLRNSS
jgi:hypothetical protein